MLQVILRQAQDPEQSRGTSYKLQDLEVRHAETTFGETVQNLEQLKQQKIIEEKNGYYFLKGRGHLYEERIEKMKIADEKWHKVRWLLSATRAVPFIRGIALSGSMGRGAAAATSDIDIFVITEKNRIWTGRFFLTLFTLLSWIFTLIAS